MQYLGARVPSNRPAKRPIDIPLHQSVLLFDSKPRKANVSTSHANRSKIKKIAGFYIAHRYSMHSYHGTCEVTLGSLNICAAMWRLLVGMGSPCGV